MEFIRNVRIEAKQRELRRRYLGFADNLSYAEYAAMSDEETKRRIIEANPIIKTDAYNRTMEHLSGPDWNTHATYVLQMRKAPHGYLITAGVEEIIRKVGSIRITQSMVDFAKEYYSHTGGVKLFDESMWQEVIDKHHGVLPFTIDCLPDGTAIAPGDPLLKISGPNELMAHFEPEFHRIFYPTLVATNAHRVDKSIGSDRFIEVGLRGVPTSDLHLTAIKAAYIGGGITKTSNDAAPAISPKFITVGTIGHRKVQEFAHEKDAFADAIRKLDTVTLLIDLYDAYNGLELALQLKQEYRNKPKTIWIRLDSGDVGAQALYALRRQQELFGHLDPQKDKVIVEGIEEIGDMARIDAMIQRAGFDPKKYIVYGAGGLLIANQTTRADASSGFKLTEYAGRPAMKFSNSPGKESIPGNPTLAVSNGKRVIAQEGEFSQSLFVRAYDHGRLLITDNIETSHSRVYQSFTQLQDTGFAKSERSKETMSLQNYIEASIQTDRVLRRDK